MTLPIVGVDPEESRRLGREIRRVARALADVRELDVIRNVLLEEATRHGWHQAAVAFATGAAAAKRDARMAAARKRLGRTDGRQIKAAVRRAAPGDRPRESRLTAALATEIRRRSRALGAAFDEAGVVYGVEPLHRTRLAAKKLRYTLELAGSAFGGAARRAVVALKKVQALMGDLHDRQMVQRHLRKLIREPSAGVARNLERMNVDLDVQCRRLHGRVLAARPAIEAALVEVDRAVIGALALERPRAARMRSGGRQARKLAG